MFTVERKAGECVKIGEEIIVELINGEDGDLQLAIDAPKDVVIVRRGHSKNTEPAVPAKPNSFFAIQNKLEPVINKLPVWNENNIMLLDPAVILYFTMDNKKVTVHAKDRNYESNSSLAELEGKLCVKGFFRCHKSFLINTEFIDKIIPWFNSTYKIKLKGTSEEIPVSRHYTKKLKKLLDL